MDFVLTRVRVLRLTLAVWGALFVTEFVPAAAGTLAPGAPGASGCPMALHTATRLLIVRSSGWNDPLGEATLYARQHEADGWAQDGNTFSVSLGRSGVGWAFDHTAFARSEEPVKAEGDGRTPLGIFAAGRPFGDGANGLSDYLTLQDGQTICVDEPEHPRYNEIASLAEVPESVSHEKMWRISLYRQGVFVHHPTGREVRGGSCIFLHLHRAPGAPTAGCVAMDEAPLVRVQHAFDRQAAAIAIVPPDGAERFAGCDLPH